MRNLKKVLALVLAMMMTLSLMVTVNAADYNDANDIAYDEAVAVMSAVGVFKGTSGNNFDPDGSLTRAQAAKIITYMLLGETVADALPNTGSKFTDCRDGQWYVGSVNYLSDAGIINGRSATVFDPNGTVTGIEFAKMLLGALGYDSEYERFVGTSNWSTNIALMGRQAGLDKDMTTSVMNSNALTRQQACQMAFNTLKANMVYYVEGMNVTTPDGTVVKNPATRRTVDNNTGKGYLVGTNDTTMQFCELYFDTLKLNAAASGTDDLGRKLSGEWTLGNESVFVGTNKTAAVFTAATSAKDVKDALAGYTWPATSPSNSAPKSITVTEKGTSNSWSLNAIGDTDDGSVNGINEITANGRQVEVYADDNNEITEIVAITYTLDTLNRISTASNGNKTYAFATSGTKTNKADGTQTQVVFEGDVAAGDTVTVVQGTDSLHVYPTTTVTGKQTAFNSSSKVITVGGEKYTIGAGVTGVTANVSTFPNDTVDATYYLDLNGFVVKREGAIPVEQFVYILGANGSVTNSVDGKTVSVEVRAVLSDGTVGVYDLEVAQASATADYKCGDVTLAAHNVAGSEALTTLITTGGGNNLMGNAYQYSTNNDGQLVLYALTNGESSFTADKTHSYTIGSKTVNNIGTGDGEGYKGQTSWQTYNKASIVLMSAKTDFVLITGTGAKATATLVTGTSGLKLDANGNAGVAVTDDTGASKVVFLTVTAPSAETVDYVYIDASEFVETIDEDGAKLKEYVGIDSEGKEVTVYGPAEGAKAITADGIYAYDADNKVSLDSKKAAEDTTTFGDSIYAFGEPASKAGGTLLALDSKNLNVTDETNVVYLDQNATGWDGAKCYVVLKAVASGTPIDVATIYIVAAKDERSSMTATATAPTDLDMNGNGSGTEKKTADVTITVTAPADASNISIKSVSSSDSSKVEATKKGTDLAVTVTAKAEASNVTITVVLTDSSGEYKDTTVTFKVDVANS